jgi:hypothetical protein
LQVRGDDEHLPGRDPRRAVAKIDPDVSVHVENRLVGVALVATDKVSSELHDLELVVVHLREDLQLLRVIEKLSFCLRLIAR